MVRTARRVRALAPDFFNALHLTPLPWTAEAKRAEIVQPDWRRWDYRHPVVQPRRMSLAGLALAVKLSEGGNADSLSANLSDVELID